MGLKGVSSLLRSAYDTRWGVCVWYDLLLISLKTEKLFFCLVLSRFFVAAILLFINKNNI